VNKNIKKKILIPFSSFYQHFIGEISCFFPFIISSISSIQNCGNDNFNGFINDILHLLTFFFFNFMAISGLIISFMSAKKDAKI
jgi:hypothetical protein